MSANRSPRRTGSIPGGFSLRPLRLAAWLIVAVSVSAPAQPTVRRATNIAAVLAYPSFYHLRPILLTGTVAQQANGAFSVSDGTGRSLRVIPDGTAPDGLNEVRGVFWDIGRMKSDDPRLASMDVRATFGVDDEDSWPRPGDVMVIIAAAITPAPPPPAIPEPDTRSPGFPVASMRSIVLDPLRYIDQQVTVVGQYYGRNLMGDLPDAPGQTRFDFVLRSADASLWVTNLPPRGKDANGRSFELGLDARIDTGRWLQVSGTVRQGRGLIWIDGRPGSLVPAQPPAELAEVETPVRVPAAPPPEVIFSAPTEDETDVSPSTNVRIQFSRDIDPATLRGTIRVSYREGRTAAAAAAPLASGDFTFAYSALNRVLELKFVKPLERFRTLRIDLLEGILGTDRQPLKPFALTFTLGES